MTIVDSSLYGKQFPIHLRFAREEDLRRLEWCGQYRHFRKVYQHSFLEQRRGCRLILVADCRGIPVGQLFIQLCRGKPQLADGTTCAYLYAFRVLATFRNRGIGTTLLHEAEQIVAQHGFTRTTIAVSKHNQRAYHLYLRKGYQSCGEDAGSWQYTDHKGVIRQVNDPCWILEKHLKVM